MSKDRVESRTPETPYELTDNERQIQNVYCWLRDRAANCRRLAESKTGSDRAGWLEDAVYLDDAMSLILLAARPSVPQQGQAQTELQKTAQIVVDRYFMERPDFVKKYPVREDEFAEMKNLSAALAASRSEEATPQLSQWTNRDMRVGERLYKAGAVTDIDILDHAARFARESAICARCEGTGKYARMPDQIKFCSICDGTGIIKEDAGAPAAGSTERWIPVSEKLPEEKVAVLVAIPAYGKIENGFCFSVAIVQKGRWIDEEDEHSSIYEPLYWQPLIPPVLAGTDTEVAKEPK